MYEPWTLTDEVLNTWCKQHFTLLLFVRLIKLRVYFMPLWHAMVCGGRDGQSEKEERKGRGFDLMCQLGCGLHRLQLLSITLTFFVRRLETHSRLIPHLPTPPLHCPTPFHQQSRYLPTNQLCCIISARMVFGQHLPNILTIMSLLRSADFQLFIKKKKKKKNKSSCPLYPCSAIPSGDSHYVCIIRMYCNRSSLTSPLRCTSSLL